MARRKKARGRGVRYSAAEKKRIMVAARKGSLTGAQVQKQFGVSPLTYYRWRGPVLLGASAREPLPVAQPRLGSMTSAPQYGRRFRKCCLK